MAEAKTERLEIRLEPRLLELVDQTRGDVSRARFVRRALLDAVGASPEDRVTVLEEAARDMDRRLSRLEEMAQGASY